MAKRRMFSMEIIDTDNFIEMPRDSRLLYYELCMRADDDGFVSSPKKILKVVGCSDKDLELLIDKNFVIPFSSGVVVIRHWKIHNYIQKDRYKETIYTIEKSLLNQGENGIYIQSDDTLDTNCVHIGYSGKVRLELGKSKSESKSKENVILVEQVIDYMNNLAGTNFKSTTKKTQSLINARIKEGVTLEELVSVVYYKYQTWVVKPFKFSNGVMSDTYFRPNTLFGTKFEEYLEDYKKQVKSNE